MRDQVALRVFESRPLKPVRETKAEPGAPRPPAASSGEAQAEHLATVMVILAKASGSVSSDAANIPIGQVTNEHAHMNASTYQRSNFQENQFQPPGAAHPMQSHDQYTTHRHQKNT